MLWLLAVMAAPAAVASVLGTGLVLRALRRRAILDRPNERSSHDTATPIGGGLAVVAVIVFEWLLIWLLDSFGVLSFPYEVPLLLVIASGLAAVSWYDDLHGLKVSTRLLVQAAAVTAGLATLSADGNIFQGVLPYALDVVAAAFLWLWFINLTNFMDGIDGITGIEGGSIGLGVALLAALAAAGSVIDNASVAGVLAIYGIVLAAALAGFLVWNWRPAKIFLGDVGSVPIGFLLGWLLLETAGSGLWAAAILLPLYYLADATITLLLRALRRERIFRAHRSHFYQRAARRFGSHATVVLAILALNIGLIALALISATRENAALPALAVGIVLTAGLLWYFGRNESGRDQSDGAPASQGP